MIINVRNAERLLLKKRKSIEGCVMDVMQRGIG